jgi:uncharacterized protein (DUF302 family)
MRPPFRCAVIAALCPALAAAPAPLAAQAAPQAVFLTLADSVPGALDEIAAALRGGFAAAGWEVLAVYAGGAAGGGAVASCSYGSRILVVHSPAYARAVLAHGAHAAFALPLRLAVFQDEAGTHVAVVNPLSINRTIVAERGFDAASEAVLRDVGGIVAGAVRGVSVRRPYGQVRRRGYIGRTMGIMAGGPFPDKIETVHAVADGSAEALTRTAGAVWSALQAGGRGRWQIRGVYRLDLPEHGVVILGVSGPAMEARAYEIVGAGSDDSRSGYRCPGIAYGPAFPVEVVVMRDSGQVRVTLVDEMYRMKLYFEDAGRMKFAANMGMPGSIENEIRSLIAAGVGAGPGR